MNILISDSRGRPDPADLKLEELYKKQNYKQALADIEKRLKKSKSGRLLLNKAIVLYGTGDRAQPYKVLDQVADLNEAFTDQKILTTLDQFSKDPRCPPDTVKRIRALWDKALGKSTTIDEESLNALFESKILSHDYVLAQKIALTRRTSSREWRMRWIVASHLVAYSTSSKATEQEIQVSAKMALLSISKDAANAIKDPEYLSAMASDTSQKPRVKVEVLQGPRDLDLLLKMFSRNKNFDQAISIFESLRHMLKPGSSHSMVKEYMEMLRQTEKWDKLWAEGEKFLRGAIEHDESAKDQDSTRYALYSNDWDIWKMMAVATMHLSTEEYEVKFNELVDCFTSVDIRHVRLTRIFYENLKLEGKKAESQAQIDTQGRELANLCLDYFKASAGSSMCFRDLKIATALQEPHLTWFLDEARSHARSKHEKMTETQASKMLWIRCEIDSLKQDYYRRISSPQGSDKEDLVASFVANCLRLYQTSLHLSVSDSKFGRAERHIGDDAGILAVMGLLNLWNKGTGSSSTLLHSTLVLENLLARSPHNYEARLLAIRVYTFLGITTRAIELYNFLDAKNLQSLSTAWVIITRLSSINCLGSTARNKSVYPLLEEVHDTVRSLQRAYEKTTRRYFKESSWRPLLEHLECFGQLGGSNGSSSIPVHIAQAEYEACSTRDGRSVLAGMRGLASTTMVDYREATAFADYENDAAESSLEMQLRCGNQPAKEWVLSRLQNADLRASIQGKGSPFDGMSTVDIWNDALLEKRKRRDILDDTSNNFSELTRAERLQTFTTVTMYTATTFFAKAGAQSQISDISKSIQIVMDEIQVQAKRCTSDVDTAVQAVQSKDSAESTFELKWEWFHQMTVLLDCVRDFNAFVVFIALQQTRKKLSLGSEYTKAVGEYSKEINELVKQQNEGLKRLVELYKDPGVIEALVSKVQKGPGHDGYQDVATLLSGDDWALDVREHCLNVLAGWRDSLTSAMRLMERAMKHKLPDDVVKV